MAKKLKVGDEINGYTIDTVFGPGAMAISYAARGPGGTGMRVRESIERAPRPRPVGLLASRTDDRGDYRLFTLPLGEYYVLAEPRLWLSGAAMALGGQPPIPGSAA